MPERWERVTAHAVPAGCLYKTVINLMRNRLRRPSILPRGPIGWALHRNFDHLFF